jgi:hypothetical protein
LSEGAGGKVVLHQNRKRVSEKTLIVNESIDTRPRGKMLTMSLSPDTRAARKKVGRE